MELWRGLKHAGYSEEWDTIANILWLVQKQS
jgi:hypothetical protein